MHVANRFHGAYRLAVVAVCLGSLTATAQEASPPLDSNVPLWQLEAFDRVQLTDGDFRDIYPERIPDDVPLPDVDDEYVGVEGLPSLARLGKLRNAKFRIRLMEDEREYEIFGRSVRAIVYYEDMLLDQAEGRITSGEFEQAHQNLLAVQERSPDWQGLGEVRILWNWTEAERLELRNPRLGFLTLREGARLFDRLPNDTDDYTKVARARRERLELRGVDEAAFERRLRDMATVWFRGELGRRNYDEARRIVSRLEAELGSEFGQKLRDEMTQRARGLLLAAERSVAKDEPATAYEQLWEAVELVPDDKTVRSEYTKFHAKYPVLRVASEQVPSYRVGPGGWSPAEWRSAELLHLPLMRVDRSVMTTETIDPPFLSDIVRDIERTDINRRAEVTLNTGLRWPQDGKPVTVIDLQRLLARSCEQGSFLYSPALDRLLTNLKPELPDRLAIEFDRPQAQPAAWLQTPFFRVGGDGYSLSEIAIDGLGPFQLLRRADDRAVFRANPRYLKADRPKLQLVIDRRIDEPVDRLQALMDGRIDLISHVPPKHLHHVREMEGARLVREAAPRVHLLHFGYERIELRNRTLRRAIAYAIDREAVFAAVRIRLDDENRLLSAPVPFGSFGYEEELPTREPDPYLAKALLLAVKRELGALPQLTLAHTGNETTRVACERIAASLRRIGLEVRILDKNENPGLDPLRADLRYESYLVTDPVFDVIQQLTRNNPSLVRHASPWLGQMLADLVAVPNRSAARDLLPELYEMLDREAAVIPLWQWYDHFAIASTVGDMPKAPATVYSGIEEWTVEPRFPPANW